jgi:hypothetical protein
LFPRQPSAKREGVDNGDNQADAEKPNSYQHDESDVGQIEISANSLSVYRIVIGRFHGKPLLSPV